MSMKHVHQKQRIGRTFLKETFLIPFFVLAFATWIIRSSNKVTETATVYDLHELPPLSSENPWGIFSPTARGNTNNQLAKTLYYSPSGHPGVEALIVALMEANPSIDAIPAADSDDVIALYGANFFDTWGALDFSLSEEQLSSGLLVTSESDPSSVSYNILINTFTYSLPVVNFTSQVYNDQAAQSDAYWSAGYLTLQNFVSTYLARNYSSVAADFSVNTLVQRYPKSAVYEQNPVTVDMAHLRWSLWKWIAPTMLVICMFIPMLGLLTEAVRERQYKMKDLLEISGLMNSSYWSSYLVTLSAVTQLTIWFCCLLLWGLGILDAARVQPYAALLTVFTLGLGSFSMLSGFVIFRSEYYGLPTFVVNTALTIAGCYLALDYGTSIDAKLVIAFFHPSLAFTLGIMSIETFLYHNRDSAMNYNYDDTEKNFPSLNSLLGVMLLSAFVYYLLVLGAPFDWAQRAWNSENKAMNATTKEEQLKYPSDIEHEAEGAAAGSGVEKGTGTAASSSLLDVRELSHIYADGTRAVSDMSFHIREGEVLSFLGANGAGKSTTMGMLCGTLDATFGDASVNGYSITSDRTSARRNLGIAMQQDIIWNDVSVEDHLFLFGSLRGLHGAALRADVDKMVESLGFPEKRKSLAGTLSGGQKRRLCVGISMVGGNSVVYLDEPTAGLDPVSRRQLWELVQRNRAGRAILLTTHFMDEADVLGDRIAIVKEGRLRALGTSKFLKKRFGLGYLLKMSLTAASADVSGLVSLVTSYVVETSVASNAGTELALRLPKEAVSQFPALFESLEKKGAALGMLSYGIETTTLEEVFMRIVNEDSESLLQDHDKANKLLTAPQEERDAFQKALQQRDEQRSPLRTTDVNALLTKGDHGTEGGSNKALLAGQVRVMLIKRYHQFVRSKGQWALGLVCPLVFAIVMASILKSMPTTILAPTPSPTTPTFVNPFPVTPLAGSDQTTSEVLFTDAFGVNEPFTYIPGGYQSLFEEVQSVAGTEEGNSSVVGVYFETQNNFTVLYNASYPIDFAGAVTNMLNSATSAATGNLLEIQSTFQQLPVTLLGTQLNGSILAAILLSLFVGAIGAGLSIVVGGERVQLVKHQQLASGASKFAYWTANFCFDFLVMFGCILLLATLLAIFYPTDYAGSGYGVVVGGGIPFIVASLFRFYCISFWVDDIRMAQTVYFYGSLFTIFALYTLWILVVFIVGSLNAASPIAKVVGGLATIVDPTFGYFLIIVFQHNFLAVRTLNAGEGVLQSIAGVQFGLLFLDALLYLAVLWRLECGSSSTCCVSKVTPTTDKHQGHIELEEYQSTRPQHPAPRSIGAIDPDVAAEREKVRYIAESGDMSAQKSAIFISRLRKVYYGKGSVPSKVAVKDVSISIPLGEVFGLLGANGAGKTTLLKMVSGQEKPTSGVALINGYDVEHKTSEAQRSMGLCPQFDTLVERLTVKENLLFFGQIKGLKGAQLVSVCEAFMVAMNIKRYQHKLIQQLSGGNRRKVSLAVALLGAPPTVYLDEPSTGLDPVASRLMWRLLSKVSSARTTAIVLTTHNMLECEAVCTRVCIMKMGAMVCLGDSQHLRSVHGTGFLLELTLLSPSVVDAAKQFVKHQFPGAVVVDEHLTMINFEIPQSSIERLSAAFRLLEQHKEPLGVVDYALSQSTLEQVFLKQIRPNNTDTQEDTNPEALSVHRKPVFSDYVMGYSLWFCAALLPGLHHFVFGNRMRGLKYLLTANEVYAGWLLDLFEMHVMIQQSVQEHGHIGGGVCCSSCCKACGGKYDGVLKDSPV